MASVEMVTTSWLKTPDTLLFLECFSAQRYMIPSSNFISFHYFLKNTFSFGTL